MPHKVLCLVIGPFPPPLHGFSAVTAAICDRFKTAGLASLQINTASCALAGNPVTAVFRRLGALSRLSGLLPTRRPSTVYMALSGGGGQIFDLLALLITRAFRCQIILHHHSYSYLDRSHPMTRMLVCAAGKAATHIVLCPQMAIALRQHYAGAARVVVISNAALVGLAKPVATVAATERATVRTVGFLSNITIDKGIERFIALASLVRNFTPKISAQVAGPIAEPKAQPLIEEAVAAETIAYRGPVYDAGKDSYLDEIDALVFPSIYPNECEPLVILEALRAGVPVIATARGCIPSMIDEFCGLLIDRDAKNLAPAAERIRYWAERPAEFAAARTAARQRFERLYRDGERALEELIREILAGRSVGERATQNA